MNNKQRFLNTILGRPVDRAPFCQSMGLWGETLERWHGEGLASDGDWEREAGFDPGITWMGDDVGIRLGLMPWYESEVLEVRERTRVVRDGFGIVKEERLRGASIPRYIAYPVATADDWKRVKEERLRLDSARLTPEFLLKLDAWRADERFLCLGSYPYGLFGTLRDLMGLEAFLIALHEQPELIEEMMDHLTTLWLHIYAQVTAVLKVDCVHIWEDMSGTHGPLMSPAMVRTFMLPHYRRIAAFCKSAGIEVLSVDTDGDCSQLAPLFVEAGVNLLFPFEAGSRMDVADYLEKYPTLAAMGGIDKRALEAGPEAIDRELLKVERALKIGRYIPHVDHLVHPGVSYPNFLYYAKRLGEILGV